VASPAGRIRRKIVKLNSLSFLPSFPDIFSLFFPCHLLFPERILLSSRLDGKWKWKWYHTNDLRHIYCSFSMQVITTIMEANGFVASDDL
jgi:hypothetical protein